MTAGSVTSAIHPDLPNWGRVLITGGTDWPNLGRKATKPSQPAIANADRPDLLGPHILRSVCNVRMQKVFSSHSSCHSVLVSVEGDAYVVGRNEQGQCGLPVGLTSGPKPSGPAIWEAYKLDRQSDFSPPLAADDSKSDIVYAATGRNHTLLVTSAGSVYASGLNTSGQCGLPSLGMIASFQKIQIAPFIKEKDPVVSASCGLTFSMLVTASGKLYTMGSSEKGQLGNGRTGEHFISGNKLAFNTFKEPFLVKALADKKMVQVACGQQHTIAMDDNGFVYVWGFGGYGRLGIGSQQDQLFPTLVPQFSRDNVVTRAKHIFAGPTNSAVIDGQRMFWLAGKWKTSGEGSAGQGFMTFKYLPDLMGCKIRNVGLGGVTLFCTAQEDATIDTNHDATMNVCWGQNAYHGELGLGEGKPKSATKPIRCETLDGISILDIAAGQNTTLYVARNLGDTYSDLPRFPENVESSDFCIACNSDDSTADDNVLLECEKCENPWHLPCLEPPLSTVPEGEWHCPNCLPTDPTMAAGGNDAAATQIATTEEKKNANGKRTNDESQEPVEKKRGRTATKRRKS